MDSPINEIYVENKDRSWSTIYASVRNYKKKKSFLYQPLSTNDIRLISLNGVTYTYEGPQTLALKRWLIKSKDIFNQKDLSISVGFPSLPILPNDIQKYINSYLVMTDIYRDYFGLYINHYQKKYPKYVEHMGKLHEIIIPSNMLREIFLLLLNSKYFD